MSKRWPDPIKDSTDKRQMYRQYIHDIHTMQRLPYNEAEADECYEELLWDEHYDFWIPIQHEHKTVGFFTMCPTPHCPPNVDYILRDAYVQPEYRRLGLMKTAVSEWIEAYPGVYEVHVLDNNKPAYNCWLQVFESAGYQMKETFAHTERNGDPSTFFRFEPVDPNRKWQYLEEDCEE
jgi:predicted acetyltransferase